MRQNCGTHTHTHACTHTHVRTHARARAHTQSTTSAPFAHYDELIFEQVHERETERERERDRDRERERERERETERETERGRERQRERTAVSMEPNTDTLVSAGRPPQVSPLNIHKPFINCSPCQRHAQPSKAAQGGHIPPPTHVPHDTGTVCLWRHFNNGYRLRQRWWLTGRSEQPVSSP